MKVLIPDRVGSLAPWVEAGVLEAGDVFFAFISAIAFAMILAVVAAWFLVPGIQERAGDQDTIQGKSGRFILWTEALSTLSPAQLPLGTGLGSAEAHLGNNVHNDYLRIWVEGGVLGEECSAMLSAFFKARRKG